MIKGCDICKDKQPEQVLCKSCNYKTIAIRRYADSNIPVEYWFLDMETHFKGFPALKKKYDEYTSDIKKTYLDGLAVCFAGSYGVGKSLTSACILKVACLKGYTCLYTTLTDIVNIVVSGDRGDKFDAIQELKSVDFLVIDEFDSRHMGSEGAAELFGRVLEDIFRSRLQNQLPIIICTNNINVTETLPGDIQKSIGSLWNKVKQIPIIGSDFRKTNKK